MSATAGNETSESMQSGGGGVERPWRALRDGRQVGLAGSGCCLGEGIDRDLVSHT
jgi:hypothetical protein